MTEEQNLEWLTTLKGHDKELQWSMIKERYFFQSATRENIEQEKNYVPLLIIDGVPLLIADSLNDNARNELLSLLTEDKIESITVMNKEPEEFYICKAFTGIILIKLNNKRTSKRLQKLKHQYQTP